MLNRTLRLTWHQLLNLILCLSLLLQTSPVGASSGFSSAPPASSLSTTEEEKESGAARQLASPDEQGAQQTTPTPEAPSGDEPPQEAAGGFPFNLDWMETLRSAFRRVLGRDTTASTDVATSGSQTDQLFGVASETCELYPIALSAQTLAPLEMGDTIANMWNGAQPGNFGWLAWTSDTSEAALATSLTPPGNSDTYINPNNPNDRVVSGG